MPVERQEWEPQVYTVQERPDLLGEPANGWLEGAEWVWCFHCERVWPVAQLRLMELEQRLPRYAETGYLLCCADPACEGCGPDQDLRVYQRERRGDKRGGGAAGEEGGRA